jgi:mersacidin/lichenicidin family type 2 lantibiotic
MKKTVRAWKDARYRQTLTDAERAALPPHPAGVIELAPAELEAAAGAGCSAQTRVCDTHSGSCDCFCRL